MTRILPSGLRWLYEGGLITKDELVGLTELRVKEADALAAAGHYSGAYYLLGYAVECALKALIAGEFKPETIPHPKDVASIFHHRLSGLAERAGLKRDIETRMKADPTFEVAWMAVQQWSADARYQVWTRDDYVILSAAVSDPVSGLLPWIRTLSR
jgi:hypothetical protein